MPACAWCHGVDVKHRQSSRDSARAAGTARSCYNLRSSCQLLRSEALVPLKLVAVPIMHRIADSESQLQHGIGPFNAQALPSHQQWTCPKSPRYRRLQQ